MKYFIVEGTINNSVPMKENTMEQHIVYSQKAMDEGLILMSGLKSEKVGGLFIMKAESYEEVEKYLSFEPLKLAGIQDYCVKEFSIHYLNKAFNEWE